jgi:simple sugar transport system permease protein
MTLNFGYIAFLAAWLARHDPVKVAGAALLFALIAIGGDSLQLDSGLPAAAVNVLMGLVLVAVMGRGQFARPGASTTAPGPVASVPAPAVVA